MNNLNTWYPSWVLMRVKIGSTVAIAVWFCSILWFLTSADEHSSTRAATEDCAEPWRANRFREALMNSEFTTTSASWWIFSGEWRSWITFQAVYPDESSGVLSASSFQWFEQKNLLHESRFVLNLHCLACLTRDQQQKDVSGWARALKALERKCTQTCCRKTWLHTSPLRYLNSNSWKSKGLRISENIEFAAWQSERVRWKRTSDFLC